MRKFNITVDGKNYIVEVEELGNSTSTQSSEAISKTEVKASAPAQAPAKAVSGEGEPIKAPMPGVILSITADNKNVKTGDPILVMEAMKMENNISAPKDGFVTVVVSKGANVNTGDILAYIK